MTDQEAPPKRKGGRPKGKPEDVRVSTIGVRVSVEEYADLRAKAEHLGMTPAQWLRQAALTRRLPPPPVPAVNRQQYVELARLSANLNMIAKHANSGKPVTVATELLARLTREVSRLRLELIGVKGKA